MAKEVHKLAFVSARTKFASIKILIPIFLPFPGPRGCVDLLVAPRFCTTTQVPLDDNCFGWLRCTQISWQAAVQASGSQTVVCELVFCVKLLTT